MRFSKTSLCLLAIVPATLASTCTTSNGLSWPPTSGDGSSTTSGSGDCAVACGSNAACVTACLDEEQIGQCNSVGCNEDEDNDGTTDDDSDSGLIKRLQSRDSLSCTTAETCYVYTDGSLLCLNSVTGDYHDDIGGKGNAVSGVYTAPNGQVETVLAGETGTIDLSTATRTDSVSTTGASTATRTADTAAASLTTSTSFSDSTASSKSGSSTATTSSAAAATTTAGSGAERVAAAAALGGLGLIALLL